MPDGTEHEEVRYGFFSFQIIRRRINMSRATREQKSPKTPRLVQGFLPFFPPWHDGFCKNAKRDKQENNGRIISLSRVGGDLQPANPLEEEAGTLFETNQPRTSTSCSYPGACFWVYHLIRSVIPMSIEPIRSTRLRLLPHSPQ